MRFPHVGCHFFLCGSKVTLSGKLVCFPVLCSLSLFLTACGGRSLNKNAARDLIVDASGSALNDENTYIESVLQTGERDAVVESRLPVVFRFERAGNKWAIKEVKLGRGQWVSFSDFRDALKKAEIEDTKDLLQKVAEAIERYRQKNGRLPEFRDFVSLSNVLNPDYLTPLIRVDAWKHPLYATRQGQDTISLISAGPDGKDGTSDDIVLTRDFSHE